MRKRVPSVAYRKVYNWTIKYVVLLFICALFGLCSVYIYFFYSNSSMGENMMIDVIPATEQLLTNNRTFPGRKFVHLDLKGAPPKVKYYEYLFPLLAESGVDGLVIEYEDTFPFKGLLNNISAYNAYTKNEIEMINILADKNNLEIIPLVHTLGHLEFVLKLEEFEELREIPMFPQTLCPSKDKSLHLVTEMLTQIIEAHPYTHTIHIGADEAHYLGRCNECTRRMKLESITFEELFLKHIRNIRSFIRRKYPLLKILIWDDMLRSFSEDESVLGLDKLDITPVVWQYETDVFNVLGPTLWSQYSKFFKNVWIASSFKGVTGVDQYIVDVPHYNQNHMSWMQVVKSYKSLIKFEAIIITGWQRYDHFSVLCELLPVGIPSLLMNLKILNGDRDYRFGPTKEVARTLHCQQPYALMGPSLGSPQCTFLGSDILDNVYRLHQFEGDLRRLRKNPKIRGWMSYYNRHHNFSSPSHIHDIAPQLSHLGSEIKDIELHISKALLEIYDESTKDEWILTHIYPFKKEIDELLRLKDQFLSKKIWPRRPFL